MRQLALLGLVGGAAAQGGASALGSAMNAPGTGQWTEWLSRDLPSGFGDDESITSLRDDGLIPCSNPTEIECRTIDGIPWDESGQTLATQCTIDGGLVCVNEDNPVMLGRRLQFDKVPPRRRLKFSAPENDTEAGGEGGRRMQSFGSLPPPPPGPAEGSPEAIREIGLVEGSTEQRVTCADYWVRVFCPPYDQCTPFKGMKHPTEDVCCAEECGGYCGAVNCAEGPGGADACCANTIATLGKTCSSRTLAPCDYMTETTCDPCVCDLDGQVNGIDTMRPGCKLHEGATTPQCSVSSGCNSMGARESVTYPGTKFRPCSEGEHVGDMFIAAPGFDHEPETDYFCDRVVAGPDGTAPGEWETVVNRTDCVVLEESHHNIPVVGPSDQGHTSYVIEHSYGAVVAARLRDAWLQSDCDLTDSETEPEDPERDVTNLHPGGRFGTYLDPVARHGTEGSLGHRMADSPPAHERPRTSDSATCKHRFYGDEWNVTVLPLRPMETQLTVQRVDDPESGWAYDGLRVEYTVCGQDKTGAVTQGQGLWRPSVGKKQSFRLVDQRKALTKRLLCRAAAAGGRAAGQGLGRVLLLPDRGVLAGGSAAAWPRPAVQGAGARGLVGLLPVRGRAPDLPRGLREPRALPLRGCLPRPRRLVRRHTCEALQMAARDSLGSLWLRRLCDPYFYDDGQCDVSCGASDPVRNPPQWPVPQNCPRVCLIRAVCLDRTARAT